MAWEHEIVLGLRHLINDLDNQNFTYDDERLKEVILISAVMINQEMDFINTYTIDSDECILSPDPTVTPKRDESFMALVMLKAACFIDMSELRTSIKIGGVRIRDGTSEIDTRQSADVHKLMIEQGACKMYEDAKLQYQFGKFDGGKLIIGPFTGEDHLPEHVSQHIHGARSHRGIVDNFFN